jgi:hypothetical protein
VLNRLPVFLENLPVSGKKQVVQQSWELRAAISMKNLTARMLSGVTPGRLPVEFRLDPHGTLLSIISCQGRFLTWKTARQNEMAPTQVARLVAARWNKRDYYELGQGHLNEAVVAERRPVDGERLVCALYGNPSRASGRTAGFSF